MVLMQVGHGRRSSLFVCCAGTVIAMQHKSAATPCNTAAQQTHSQEHADNEEGIDEHFPTYETDSDAEEESHPCMSPQDKPAEATSRTIRVI